MDLTLYNTLTRAKQTFAPLDPRHVRMYVCGPTMYDYAHIGNARPIIVFDVMFRLLRHVYGADHVTYARNLTDVDDKINARAAEQGVPISDVTERTIAQFHDDIDHLGVLAPTVEPKATDHIDEMRALIETLIARGHAYVAQDHVLFDVQSMPDYGKLSNRPVEDMEAGARVEVAPYKRGPMDFVLWKPSEAGEPAWPAPSGISRPGRPGWHIECSAMAGKHLGSVFDIHGGGIDIVFPHHENELAQSRCAHGTQVLANVWMHNGMVQVEGEKMSKSLGNFVTINQLLQTDSFGGQRWHGKVLKLAMLGTHYRQPIDWTVARLAQSREALCEFASLVNAQAGDTGPSGAALTSTEAGSAPVATSAPVPPCPDVLNALADDLNTPRAMSILHGLAKSARRGSAEKAAALWASLEFLGVYGGEAPAAFDLRDGVGEIDADKVEGLVQQRLKARNEKNWAESDRIRDELAAMGVQLKDGKDSATGAFTTHWERKR